MKKKIILVLGMLIGISMFGYSRHSLIRYSGRDEGYQKVCTHINRKSGRCTKYENRKISRDRYGYRGEGPRRKRNESRRKDNAKVDIRLSKEVKDRGRR